MQDREKISNMDLKAYINNLRKNPRYSDEMLKLVESDLQYGLSVTEIEEYIAKRYDYTQMKVYSYCLRNGYQKEEKEILTREDMTGEQMAVALEFYEKGVPLQTIVDIIENGGKTALSMKKLFQNVFEKLQTVEKVSSTEEDYAKELFEQIKVVVEKIQYQEKRYDSLNEKLKEINIAVSDARDYKDLQKQLSEKDQLLEKQQNELNDTRVTIARLKHEIDEIRKENKLLEGKVINTEKNTNMESENKPEQVGIEYVSAVVDGKAVSYIPIERVMQKKQNSFLQEIYSRTKCKKKMDIMKLLIERKLNPQQLQQVRSAIEKKLSEKQLLILINGDIPAEQMKEIIDIAVYENKQKEE